MLKIPKQGYTAEFKEGTAQRMLGGGEGVPFVAKHLGLIEYTLRNRVKAVKAGMPMAQNRCRRKVPTTSHQSSSQNGLTGQH